jgi:K+-sensing histidine kinase KdpD
MKYQVKKTCKALLQFLSLVTIKKIGKLIVGKKLSGDSYSPKDINLLETFTKQAGIALEKAFLYKQVEDYARTLEEKVEERTQEVVAIQKEQETMMLEISHGLQTPLTIMKGELFLMRKQGHDTKRVDTIDASIDRISSFIYRFLSLTKLESAAIIPLSRLNLSSLLTHVILFLNKKLMKKELHCQEQFRQIFLSQV